MLWRWEFTCDLRPPVVRIYLVGVGKEPSGHFCHDVTMASLEIEATRLSPGHQRRRLENAFESGSKPGPALGGAGRRDL